MTHAVDCGYYPGWVRKCITFSIDGGNVPMDEIFLSYARPAGIRGTFNLCPDHMELLPDAAAYRAFYRGYEISNHVRHHPFAFEDGREYVIAEEPFEEASADEGKIYPTDVEHLYRIHRPNGWRPLADTEGYIAFADESRQALEAVFGEGTIGGFVWPFTEQKNAALRAHLENAGYYGLRRGMSVKEPWADRFPFPPEPMRWMYTANHTNLLTQAQKYEALPDDGERKFFCIGVHSIDYESAGKWDDFARFCREFGCRPGTYWYASVGEIFAADAAARSLIITEDSVTNPSDTAVYLTVDGIRRIADAHTTLRL